MNDIRIELLSDFNKIEEFAEIAWLAVDKKSVVPSRFLREINYYVVNANTKKPMINKNHGLACVLNNDGKIIGTICINEDTLFKNTAHFNYFSVLPGQVGKMHGSKLLLHACEIVNQYSNFEYILGSSLTGAHYKEIGIKKIGKITANGQTKYFYGKELCKER